MKVKQVIKELQKYNPEAEVWAYDRAYSTGFVVGKFYYDNEDIPTGRAICDVILAAED